VADQFAKRRVRGSVRHVSDAAAEASTRISHRDALFGMFVEELGQLMEGNGKTLGVNEDSLRLYERFREMLSPSDRDEFLRCVLIGVQQLADEDRLRLRAIFARHLQLLSAEGAAK
jgi:hypothetical protein